MPTESHKLILLEDISRIVVTSHDLRETLDNITALLSERMGAEVCSIYLEEAGHLVLHSTRGLSQEAVGRVRMANDEGLTGLTFTSAAPVNVERAETHPKYRYFPGIGEESFFSYLGVPLLHRRRPLGVLTVQTRTPRRFTPDEVRMLVTAASQVSTVIAHAGLLAAQAGNGSPRQTQTDGQPFLKGIAVASGVAIGAAYPLTEELGLEPRPTPPPDDPEAEVNRLDRAVARSIEEVEQLRDQVTRALSEEEGAIFHAHLLILEDRSLQDKIRGKIRDGVSGANAVVDIARTYIGAFLDVKDPYLRERAADVRDVAVRLLHHLEESGQPGGILQFTRPTVVVADDLTPSRFVQLLQPNLAGVALGAGGRTSHTAILCRSAGIPAVMGLGRHLPHLDPGTPVILDGHAGVLYRSPSESVRTEYTRILADSCTLAAELQRHIGEPPVSRDGVYILVQGNAALVSDVPRIVEGGAEGVGLYRTEFPFLIRSGFPDEDEQLDIYRRILEALEGRPATLRTLDVGGDKSLPYLPLPPEDNPHLGWRSIRISLEMHEPFRIQVRALLRASLLGPVRIVFPMISTVAELRQARAILEEERDRLGTTGIEVPRVPVGAMIEVPSAALAIERLAPLADFFSVGTNDLVQYLLAVDRANPRVAHMYDPLHPTVLDVVGRVVETALRCGRPVGVCGEMASRGLGATALLAVGIRELSVSPGSLPRIRRLIQTLDVKRLEAIAGALRASEGAPETRALLETELKRQNIPETLWAQPA